MTRKSVALAFVALTIMAACWPMLCGYRFAFRDVSHFYLPLYDYIAERTSQEWLPLWNPLDQLGMPLVGESSTAVLYPIRFAVYCLPVAPETAMNVYLIIHLLIASATAGLLAQRSFHNRLSTVAAAIIYPLSGSVFALCCNPPFLVGAAWMPLALCYLMDLRPTNEAASLPARRSVVAAIALALMVLGGDPQTAFHCVLIAITYWTVKKLARWRRPNFSTSSISKGSIGGQFRSGILVCLIASAIAGGLSILQIAASTDWSRQSDRVAGTKVHSEIYEFSLAPWHSLEVVTARPFGHPFPVHRRIAKLIPGEGRMWTPSIYAGLIVGVALLSRLLRPKGYFDDPWFVIAVVSLAFCFGNYGPVWIAQQIPGVFEQAASEIGSPYWMLTEIIPGYDSFRYPVKWLPVFSLASTMIAAKWLQSKQTRREQILLITLGVTFLVVAGVAHWATINWSSWYKSDRFAVPVDEYWGPLDSERAFALMRTSCLGSVLLALVVFWMRQRTALANQRLPKRWCVAWLVLVSFDCVLNASTLLPVVSIEREQHLAHQISPTPIPNVRVLRTQSGMWPRRWRASNSEDRALEVAASERVAWFGRWHLADRRNVFNSMVSIQSERLTEFWHQCHIQTRRMSREEQLAFWRTIRKWLAVGGIAHVDETLASSADSLSFVHVDRQVENSLSFDIALARSRAMTLWRPTSSLDEIIAAIAQNGEVPIPHVAIPLSHATIPAQEPAAPPHWSDLGDDRYRVQCDSDCVFERMVFQDGNWRATLQPTGEPNSESLKVHRSSQLNQAVKIPPGDWTVSFQYMPWWRNPAIAITVISLLISAVCLIWPNLKPRHRLRGIVCFFNQR